MKSAFLFYIFAFFVSGFFSSVLIQKSWNGLVYITPSLNPRLPASIKSPDSLSFIDTNIVKSLSKKNIILGSSLSKIGHNIKLSLGQFQDSNWQTGQNFSCNKYNTIEIIFKAGDMMTNGRAPSLKVVADCRLGKNLSQLKVITIPFGEINKLKPGNQSIDFSKGNLKKVSFTNMSGEWPQVWDLHKIKFFDSHNQKSSASLSPDDVFSIQKKKLSIQL